MAVLVFCFEELLLGGLVEADCDVVGIGHTVCVDSGPHYRRLRKAEQHHLQE